MGSCTSLLDPSAVTLPAYVLPDICPDCYRESGLCASEHCRRQVLPQLAKPNALLRLIGDANVEQVKRQAPEATDRVQIARISRRNARKVARSSRRGYFGLARAIMEQKQH